MVDQAAGVSLVVIVLKLVFIWVPTPCTAVMIAMAMPAAISPYSMAVAPDSSARNFWKTIFNSASFNVGSVQHAAEKARLEAQVAKLNLVLKGRAAQEDKPARNCLSY